SPARNTAAAWVSICLTGRPPWVAGSASSRKIASWDCVIWVIASVDYLPPVGRLRGRPAHRRPPPAWHRCHWRAGRPYVIVPPRVRRALIHVKAAAPGPGSDRSSFRESGHPRGAELAIKAGLVPCRCRTTARRRPMTMLPHVLKRIRLNLARSKEHPAGSARHGYEFVAPLDANGHIDPELWRKHRTHCGFRRFWDGEPDQHGHL